MPEKLADIFGQLEVLGLPAVKNCKLTKIWPEVVGENVRNSTEAIKIKDRVLHVSTKSSVWAQELSLLKQGLIEKFNLQAGEEVIVDIRFKTMGGN
ncbi:MAG: DUF721 domain-containing protein [bacterium]